MDDVLIRRVTPYDYEDVYVLNIALGYEYPKEGLKERIKYILDNTRDIILVAEINGEVVGYIHAAPYETMYFEPMMDILGFVVKEEKRSAGVGHKLITELENIVKDCGFIGIRLVSGMQRVDAHRFYENHGYISKKVQKNFSKIF